MKEGAKTGKEVKEIEWISETVRKRANTYFGHIVREEDDEPTRAVAFTKEMPNLGWRKRKGRPRKNWIEEKVKEAWNIIKEEYQGEEDLVDDLPDLKDPTHMSWIQRGAKERLF